MAFIFDLEQEDHLKWNIVMRSSNFTYVDARFIATLGKPRYRRILGSDLRYRYLSKLSTQFTNVG